MKGVHLVVGATSGIGRAVAYELARKGNPLILSARDKSLLEKIAQDIRIRFDVEVMVKPFDVSDLDACEDFAASCLQTSIGDLHGVVCSQGYMAEQTDAADDFNLAERMISVNYTANVAILNRIAKHLEGRKSGCICGISSVAGDRGRQSNFIYGSTKAAFTCYLQGLRNRMFKHGVSVLTVKPGFVDTAMTWGILDPDSPMVANSTSVAQDIVRAIERKKHTIYTPFFWRWIMAIICRIPETIFKRLSM